jgi:NAD-dependent dihydropyrimidine dehydrogenase PreA subunit
LTCEEGALVGAYDDRLRCGPDVTHAAGESVPSPTRRVWLPNRLASFVPKPSIAGNMGVAVPFVIGRACIDVMDKSCIEECPVDCIYEGARKLYIHPTECIDCGACEPVCPVEAISLASRTPEEDQPFVADNAAFFNEPLPGQDEPLGAPGGSFKTGPIGIDTAFVSSIPEADAERVDSEG